MDDIQKNIVDSVSKHMDCIDNRGKLKGILADCLPEDKKHLNLIMDAYDEDFHLKIRKSNDKTLLALQSVKVLADNYGITLDNARWSIEVWCTLLGYEDITEAISTVTETSGNSDDAGQSKSTLDDSKEYDLGIGVYCAGIDFPSGKIVLTAKWEQGTRSSIYFEIGSNPNIKTKGTSRRFTDKTYLEIAKRQYILFETGVPNWVTSLKAKKISD